MESKFPRPGLQLLTTMCRTSSRAQACSSLPSGWQVPASRPASPYHLECKFPLPDLQAPYHLECKFPHPGLLLTIWSASSLPHICTSLPSEGKFPRQACSSLPSGLQVPASRPAAPYHLKCKFPRPGLQLLTIWSASSLDQACSFLPSGGQVPAPRPAGGSADPYGLDPLPG